MSSEIEFKTSDYSEGAAEMIAALLVKGFSSEAILMLARGYGNDATAWKACLECCSTDAHPAEKLDESLASLITEENLENVCQVMKENGLIKDFSESFREINYFYANFHKEISVVYINKDLGFPLGWILANVDPIFMEKRAESFNRAYDWCCSKGLPEYYNSMIRTYMYEVLTPMQYEEIINDIYGIPNKHCGFSTRCDQDILEDAKMKLLPHVNEFVKILMMGVEKIQF